METSNVDYLPVLRNVPAGFSPQSIVTSSTPFMIFIASLFSASFSIPSFRVPGGSEARRLAKNQQVTEVSQHLDISYPQPMRTYEQS